MQAPTTQSSTRSVPWLYCPNVRDRTLAQCHLTALRNLQENTQMLLGDAKAICDSLKQHVAQQYGAA